VKYRIGKKYVRRLKPSENPMHLKEKYGVFIHGMRTQTPLCFCASKKYDYDKDWHK
jgi:hypothetical protein